MAFAPTSLIRTAGAAATREGDLILRTCAARPQGVTYYVRFVEGGTIFSAAAALWFGFSDVAQTTEFLVIDSTGSFYRARHEVGSSQVLSTQAVAPVLGDGVELVVQMAPTGTVTLIQSINEAAPVAAATSNPLLISDKFSAGAKQFQIRRGGSAGPFLLRNVAAYRGVKDFPTMRRLALRIG